MRIFAQFLSKIPQNLAGRALAGWLAGRAGWPGRLAGLAGSPRAEVTRPVEGNELIPGAHYSILHPSWMHAGCCIQDPGYWIQDVMGHAGWQMS